MRRRLLSAAPLYQINENATLNLDGMLDRSSHAAQRIGRRYGIPVFLKTFGTDVAYTVTQAGSSTAVMMSPDITRRMAEIPHIAGAAWSADEASYRPTLFVQGAPVPAVLFPYRNRRVALQRTRAYSQVGSSDDLALNKRVPGLKLFDIKCDWFDEHVYNEYFPRVAHKRQLR